jgi:hypothetical protein
MANNSKQRVLQAPATNVVYATTGSLAASGALALAASPRMPARSTSVALPTITTSADGCLAVAVQIYSDNSDEVTGATLNGGETGGTGTKAGELLGVTGGPDGGLAVFVTEMPTAGTISGGSVNPNPTTPVNSVSLTFGFFLQGKPV